VLQVKRLEHQMILNNLSSCVQSFDLEHT
jgi:hypothetical protein